MSDPTNIIDFKNIHEGERCFIIGNGPSLRDTPLKELNDEYTFSTNKINKIFNHTGWRPTYFSYTQGRNWADNHNSYDNILQTVQSGTNCFIAPQHKEKIGKRENIFYYNGLKRKAHRNVECLNKPEPPADDYDYWSDHVHKYIYHYCSSIYPLYQLAHFMGFEKIYLLGCDLGMDTTDHLLFSDARDPYIYVKTAPDNQSSFKYYSKFVAESNKPLKSLLNGVYFKSKEVLPISSTGHQFHFSDDYQERQMIKRGTDDKQRRAHNLANKKLTERGIKIYNATKGGELDIFPRVSIKELV